MGQAVELTLQRGQLGGGALQQPGDSPDFGGHSGVGHHDLGTTAGDRGVHESHAVTITDTGVRIGHHLGVLLHRVALAGEGRLVDLQIDRGDDAAVGRDAVAGLHDDDVAGDQVHGGGGLDLTVSSDPGGGGQHAFQGVERCLGSVFLNEADGGVRQNHHQHHDGRLQLTGHREADGSGPQQDENEEVLELQQELLPIRHPCLGVQGVRPVLLEATADLVGGQTLGGTFQSSHDRVAVGLVMCERIIDSRRHRNLSDAAMAVYRRSLPP